MPDFKDKDGKTIKGALLLHQLLVEGKDDEVLRRKRKLSQGLLSRTCTWWDISEVRNKVRLRLELETKNHRIGVILAKRNMFNRARPQDEKSSNLHITADSTGSIYKNARGKKFDPKKVRLGCGDLI